MRISQHYLSFCSIYPIPSHIQMSFLLTVSSKHLYADCIWTNFILSLQPTNDDICDMKMKNVRFIDWCCIFPLQLLQSFYDQTGNRISGYICLCNGILRIILVLLEPFELPWCNLQEPLPSLVFTWLHFFLLSLLLFGISLQI